VRQDVAAIVLAGGSGTRVGSRQNKVYLPLAGRTVIAWSLDTLAGMREVGPVVLVVRAEDRDTAARVLEHEVERAGIEIVTGGATRQESELAGLRVLASRIGDGEVDVVLIHDGARPLVSRSLVSGVVRAARECGGAVPGLPRDDLAAVSPDGFVVDGPGQGLVAVQTPQGFRARPLLAAYEEAARQRFSGTDTASCVERFAGDLPVRIIMGEDRNFKITYAHDLLLAEQVLARSAAR
jgi:2-C-methyl-D-erythritol 4-phosphate cytidylyltransferase